MRLHRTRERGGDMTLGGADVHGFDEASGTVNMPHSARVDNYWLGGKDNFAVDRAVGNAMLNHIPALASTAVANRRFMRRAVTHMAAREGIRQFLDIGIGLPAGDNLHEVAQGVAPESRVVFVDNDLMVLAHARALLVSRPEGRCEYVRADLRDPAAILNDPGLRTLDLTRPVGLTLIAVLMQLADTDDPHGALAALRDALPSGSCLAISHPTADYDTDATNEAIAIANRAGMPLVARTRTDIQAFFGDWELLEPGLVPVSEWRTEEPDPNPAACYWAGVARKR
jgi:hypothetical protein